MAVLLLTIVRGLVYSGCPRSCLMAHSDRGHPSIPIPRTSCPNCHKEEKAGGLSPPRVPRDTPSLNTDEKEAERREGDDMNSNVSAGPPDPRPPGRSGRLSHSLPPEAATNDAVDPTSPPETSSAGPNATRHQSVVPAVKTRLLLRAPTISDPNCRTGLPSRLPSRSIAGYTGYTPNLHSARMAAMSKGQPAESGKESVTRRRSFAPVPAPLFISEGIYFGLRTHPLEVRWSWNCGAVIIPVVFSDPLTASLRISPILRPVTSAVPIGDTREENTADKEIGPAGPQTIPSPCSTVRGQCEFPSRRRSWRLTAVSNWLRGRNKSSNIQPYPSGTVCEQRKLAPYAAQTWRPTRESKSPKGQRTIPGSQRSASQVINHRTIS